MTDFEIGLFSGVVSGVMTSVIMLISSSYWKRIIRPWVEDMLYKGARIDGLWKSKVRVGDHERMQQVLIEQKGHKVSGTITYPEDTKGHPHVYRFEGVFADNILTLVAREVGKGRADRGALMLALQPGRGEVTITGVGLWRLEHDIRSVEYTWLHIEPNDQPLLPGGAMTT